MSTSSSKTVRQEDRPAKMQQFFDEGQLFKKMASEEEYHKDPLEIEATEFSKKVMKEYLLAVGNKA